VGLPKGCQEGMPGGNTVGDGKYFASTTGFSSGATSINLPLLMKGNAGFDTWFNVQNTGSDSTDVTVTYSNATTETATIAPGASKTFDQASNAALPTGFVGSATVASSDGQPIVASVMQVGTGSAKALLGYNSFGNGSTTITAPLVMANNSVFFTGIQVQKVGTGNCDIAVTYGPNTAGAFTPANEPFAGLTPGSSNTFLQTGASWPSIYVGSATITGTGTNCKVASIVNKLAFGVGDQFMTYQALAAD
jgi:hypothetical protein